MTLTETESSSLASGQPLLSLRGVSKAFGVIQALTDIDLDVSAGEVVALLGDNGAGKSTLVKILAGVHPSDSGTITFKGNQVSITSPTDGSGCLRWIDGTDEGNGADIGAYSGTPSEEHDDGRYWSAALTCVYEGMGANPAARDDIMELVLAHHFSLTPDSSTDAFEDRPASQQRGDSPRHGREE